MMSDISEPSSPESEMYDTVLLDSSVQDDVANQLAAAGPVGVAAAAAVMSTRKRKHPHHFETNPARRKRQQTRLLRRLRQTIEEYSSRVGQQAIVLCCTPGVSQSMQIYRVFGSQPLETVIRDNKNQILHELETALQDQTPPTQNANSQLYELPPLVIDGIPTPVDKMTQAQLRNFIPEMLKYSTARSKPGWGRPDCRPVWWPSDLPWANVRSDARTEEDKKRVPWTDALRQIVKNCYMHHGRIDLLHVFKEEHTGNVQVQQQAYQSTSMMQTINNPDGTLSIIQIDPGPNSIVTLPDGTQATVVHAIQDNTTTQQQQAVVNPSDNQVSQTTPQFGEIAPTEGTQVMNSAVTGGVAGGVAEFGTQQVSLNALQASLNSGGHIILTGADAAQLGSIMTVLPVSMYQQPTAISSLPPGISFQMAQPVNTQSVQMAVNQDNITLQPIQAVDQVQHLQQVQQNQQPMDQKPDIVMQSFSGTSTTTIESMPQTVSTSITS